MKFFCRSRWLGAAVLLLGLAAGPSAATAESPLLCAPSDEVDVQRYLRAVSLDLLGRIPTAHERDAVRRAGELDPATLSSMLASDEFFATLRRYHRELLLGTLDALPAFVHGYRTLDAGPETSRHPFYASATAGVLYRGMAGVYCVDEPQTAYDEAGRPVPHRFEQQPGCPAEGCRREGWVEVRPYWAPSTAVKVCAYDAQAAAIGLGGADCSRPAGITDAGCGCGPGLERCVSNGPSGSAAQLRAALLDEPLHIFERVVREHRPYFEALTTRETLVNGPLVHFYTKLVDLGVALGPLLNPSMPGISYVDVDRWVPVERSDEHAGVLTTFEHLLRFQSDRGRANHFFTALACRPFDAGDDDLPPTTAPCSSDPNLMERCGCATCHTTLEPAAAHFFRFRDAGRFGVLPEATLPDVDESCATCSGDTCSPRCAAFYVTADHPDEASRGRRIELAYLDDDAIAGARRGPRGLVEDEMAMLAQCTTRRVGEWLLGRPLTSDERAEWLPERTAAFADSGYDFTQLVRTIVTSDRYRRLR